MKQNKMLGMALAGVTALSMLSFQAEAKTEQVALHATEEDLPIDNKGTMFRTWTFDGKVPGPVARVTEGDTVEFTLINDKTNKNSHSIDFHAARLDVVKDFGSIRPGGGGRGAGAAGGPGGGGDRGG